jgi:D-serine dehydratase
MGCYKNNDAKIVNLILKYPALKQISSYQPVFWINDRMTRTGEAFSHLSMQYPRLNELAIRDAEVRLQRFAPLIAGLFPETKESQGIIESKLEELSEMKYLLQHQYSQAFEGRLLFKCDSHLPVAGSIKARGGIYEVLKHAEDLALKNGMLKIEDDYSILAEAYFRDFFNQYSLAVGSTGNLGLSVMLADSEQITIEPSATPGLLGPVMVAGSDAGKTYIRKNNLEKHMKNATHIAWATGGLLVPEDMMQAFYQRGKELTVSYRLF